MGNGKQIEKGDFNGWSNSRVVIAVKLVQKYDNPEHPAMEAIQWFVQLFHF
ncbi:MAG TPA: hypothetical protein VGM24_01495 [Puia sp.]